MLEFSGMNFRKVVYSKFVIQVNHYIALKEAAVTPMRTVRQQQSDQSQPSQSYTDWQTGGMSGKSSY